MCTNCCYLLFVIYRCYWVFFIVIVAVANIVWWSDHKGISNLKWLNRFDFFLCVFFLYFYINSISTTSSIIIDDCLANMWLLWRKEIAWMESTTLKNSWRVDFGDKNPDTIEMPLCCTVYPNTIVCTVLLKWNLRTRLLKR